MVLKIGGSQKGQYRSLKRFLKLLSCPIILIGLGLSYKVVQSYLVKPEAIVVLGGDADRERYAAKLAAQHPNLSIWVSSGSPKKYAQKIFKKAGVNPQRLHLDYNARDTVTNFTTLVDKLKSQKIDSVYLVTSDNHMERALIVGEIVFGSRGIVLKPLSVASSAPPEPTQKCIRDGARALFWLATGSTGESFWISYTHSRD